MCLSGPVSEPRWSAGAQRGVTARRRRCHYLTPVAERDRYRIATAGRTRPLAAAAATATAADDDDDDSGDDDDDDGDGSEGRRDSSAVRLVSPAALRGSDKQRWTSGGHRAGGNPLIS